ncbi:MAG: NAD(P)H-binding protein [Chitinophagaceae bacterium]|nr:NAD(P)H-binding protein [Chitinophagaceae bacterium]
MHILLLGSSGRTGKLLLEKALSRGYYVNALVRNKAKVHIQHPRLTLFEGTPLDKVALSSSMYNCTAILSALNISRTNDVPWAPLRTPRDFLSTSMSNIIEVAPCFDIRRVIFTFAWGVADTRSEIPGWFRWFIEHSNIRYPYDDHARQEALARESGLDWTAVRAVGLVNSTRKKEIIVSFRNQPTPRLVVSRANLADFILDVLEKDLYVKEAPVVSQRGG